MISCNNDTPATASAGVTRRRLVEGSVLGLGLGLLPQAALAQAQPAPALMAADPQEIQRIVADFARGKQPLKQSLKLELPVLGDNPASVPVKARVELPMTPDAFCEAMIIIAEGNPRPLACQFEFTKHTGTAEVAVRLRLIESQSIQALARMNDGRVLIAREHISVTAGGCGM